MQMQNWALAVCAAMVGGGLFAMLTPSGSMKRVMTFTLNLFFICALVAPFLTQLPKIDFQVSMEKIALNADLQGVTQQQVEQLAQENLKKGLKAILQQNEYYPINIMVEIDTENKTTAITVILSQANEGDVRAVEQLVKNETGILPTVLYEFGE